MNGLDDTYPSQKPLEPKTKTSATPWLLFLFTLGLAVAIVYFGLEHLREKGEALDRARLANSDLTTRLRTIEAEREALTAKLLELENQAADLSATRDSLEADLAEKDAKLKELQATYDELDLKMKKEIADGDIRLTQSGGRIQVDLIDKILFDSGEAMLSERGQEVLTRLGASLAGIKDKQIQVAGHTDDSPIRDRLKERFASNWELSAARAVNVVRFLSESAKVPASKLMATGHGPHRPIASNSTPRGRARNRRIEILLVPEVSKQKAKLVVSTEGK